MTTYDKRVIAVINIPWICAIIGTTYGYFADIKLLGPFVLLSVSMFHLGLAVRPWVDQGKDL